MKTMEMEKGQRDQVKKWLKKGYYGNQSLGFA